MKDHKRYTVKLDSEQASITVNDENSEDEIEAFLEIPSANLGFLLHAVEYAEDKLLSVTFAWYPLDNPNGTRDLHVQTIAIEGDNK